MKQVIKFSKYFLPMCIISILLCGLGVAGFFNGFNLGIDFQAGLLQEVQFAPTAMGMTYNGRGNAAISVSRTSLTILISGAGIDEVQYNFPFAGYQTIGDLNNGLSAIDGLSVYTYAAPGTRSTWLIQSSQADSRIGSAQNVLHYLQPNAAAVPIADVRASLLPLGTVSVQELGAPEERRFMIRMEDDKIKDISGASDGTRTPSEIITSTLESTFGHGEIAVIRSDYAGERFSKNLTDQASWLIIFTLLLILLYSAIRFKPRFAIGAVLGIIHDALIVIAFVAWTRMEFNTTTIAAILTILGYSINDTIVVFDRMRENRRIYPEDAFVNILNRSISESLSRTIITTLTTLLAVVSLYIFTTGSMKDFAQVLIVGMITGVYSTIFIASGFVNFWENITQNSEKKRMQAGLPSKAEQAKLAKA